MLVAFDVRRTVAVTSGQVAYYPAADLAAFRLDRPALLDRARPVRYLV